jgi:hypothetical protein
MEFMEGTGSGMPKVSKPEATLPCSYRLAASELQIRTIDWNFMEIY